MLGLTLAFLSRQELLTIAPNVSHDWAVQANGVASWQAAMMTESDALAEAAEVVAPRIERRSWDTLCDVYPWGAFLSEGAYVCRRGSLPSARARMVRDAFISTNCAQVQASLSRLERSAGPC